LEWKNRFLNLYNFFHNLIQAVVVCDCKVIPGDHWNDLCEAPHDFFLWAQAIDKLYRSKPRTQDEVELKSQTIMLLLLIYFSSKCAESVSSRLHNCA
jgi:hypothetical protein